MNYIDELEADENVAELANQLRLRDRQLRQVEAAIQDAELAMEKGEGIWLGHYMPDYGGSEESVTILREIVEGAA